MLDNVTYAGVQTKALQLCGMVKDGDKRIIEHLTTVANAAKEVAATAIDMIEINRKLYLDESTALPNPKYHLLKHTLYNLLTLLDNQ